MRVKKKIYFFSQQKTDGTKSMSDVLGGKGENMAEMCRLGLPVPPGFTISSLVCGSFLKHNRLSSKLKKEIQKNVKRIERETKKSFGGRTPCLFRFALEQRFQCRE
jgi:pyruvate,orthophosphate dikinase